MSQIISNSDALIDLKVGCFNANGLGDKHKRKLVLNWLKLKNEKIIFLQETHSTSETERGWESDWGGKIVFNHGSSNSTGIAVLFNHSLVGDINILNTVHITPGRVTLLDIETGGTVFGIVNVYCPNNDDPDFINTVFLEACSVTKSDKLILAGDWNAVLNNDLDKVGGAGAHKNANCRKLLNDIMVDWGFTDIFRLNNPNARIFTHLDKQHNTRTRLDFFLIDDSLVNLPICTSDISHGFSSDHSYVSLTLQGNPISHGRGYWKFNNSHLSSEEFTDGVRSIISEVLSGSFDSYNGAWDTIKFRVKDHAIRHGKNTKKYKLAERKLIMDKMDDIRSSTDYHSDPVAVERLAKLEVRLDNMIRDEMEGIIVRSKVQYVERGERCTKYFFGLEKNNGKKKMINKLVDETTGESLVTQEKISDHAVSFYQNLYSTASHCHRDTNSYLADCNLNKIPEMLADKLDQPITLEEMDAVVGSLKKGKSPGWDGLTAEFYQYFWEDIKTTLFRSFMESIDQSCLSPSQRIGVINLIPKPKKPPDLIFLKNWRPITLLNVDYKIFTHVIKHRIVETLPHVLSKVQSGFQSGRSTSDNLILMCLVLDHYNNNDDEAGLLLQVDFEKAFDSVDHYFLFKTMETLGFGSYLTNLVRIAFHGCLSFLNINGHLSSQVVLGRGLHQGSPLSPLLFLLVAQVFTVRLDSNRNIRGVNIDGTDILHSLFADDTDMFLEATGTCIDEVIKEIHNFGVISGCRNNIDKTCCVPLGKAKSDENLISHISTYYGNSMIVNEFSALGIYFNNYDNLRDIADRNYMDKLERATSRAKFWKSRDLSIYGRITLIKSLLMAQFVYISASLPRPSTKIVNSITKFIFNFLWGGNCDKIKRNIIVQERVDGGLGMFYPSDFLSSMKLKLLQKLGDINFKHNWKDIVFNQIKYKDHSGICFENLLVSDRNTFTSDLLHCYSEWKEAVAKCNNKCIDHCIWGNKAITDIGSKLWVPSLIDVNVNYLSEFVNDTGEVMSYSEFCTKTLSRSWHIITNRQYVDIKMAIRSFSDPQSPTRNLNNIDTNLCLKFFTDLNLYGNIKASKIRTACRRQTVLAELLPLKAWVRDLGSANIDWNGVFKVMYGGFTRNFKLLQFQYKLLMKISTCRYMRYKMKIDIVSPNCLYCPSRPETLQHIFLECPKSIMLSIYVEHLIINNIDPNYSDPNKIYFLTCCHDSPAINFIWASFKLYISRSFQLFKEPSMAGYNNYLRSIFYGEKVEIVDVVKETFGL